MNSSRIFAYFWFFALLIFILLTNQWQNQFLDWSQQIINLQAFDVNSYLKIAQAFPGLPSATEQLPQHHLQRFFFHSVTGGLSKFFHCDLIQTYRWLWAILYSLIFYFFYQTLKLLTKNYFLQSLGLILLLVCPYTFRYYALVPGMLQDYGFLLFEILFIYYFLKQEPVKFIICLGLGLLARQTGLLLIPLIYFYPNSKYRLKYLMALLVVAATILGIEHFSTARLAGYHPSAQLFLGLIIGSVKGQFSFAMIAEHLARCFLPFLAGLTFLSTTFHMNLLKPRSAKFLFAGFIMVISQPVLTDIIVVGANASRLASLALPFFILFTITNLEQDRQKPQLQTLLNSIRFLLLLAILSLHHLYSKIAPANLSQYLGLQLLASLGLTILAFKLKKTKPITV